MEDLHIDQTQLIRQLGLGLSTIVIAATLLALGIADFRHFKALGPGGVSFDLRGWLFVTIRMRPFTLSQRQTASVNDYPDTGASAEILSLPTRKGPRPVVGGIVPQRQLSDRSSAGRKKELQGIFGDVVALNPTMLEVELSHSEKSNPAVYVHHSLLDDTTQPLPEAALVSWGQIGHIHTDSSFHLHFKPADARIVLERGWGERHGLARTQPWYMVGIRNEFGVPPNYVLVYGPRNQDEVAVAKVLLNASVKFMTGREELKTAELVQ